jgi:hypothetical protein
MQAVLQDTDGDIQANTPVQVVAAADGTTPYAGALYAAESGGSPTTSFQSDTAGLVKVYTALADRGQAKLRVNGAAALPAVFPFYPAPEDVIVQQQSTLATLAAGLSVTDGGASIARNENAYALTTTQSHANNLIQKWVDNAANSVAIMTGTGLYMGTPGTGLAIGSNGLNNNLVVAYQPDTDDLASGVSFITADFQLIPTNANADHGVIRAVLNQSTAGGGDSAGRAGEFHAIRQRTNGTATLGIWGLEVSVDSMTPSGSSILPINVGIYLYANTNQWAGNGGAGVVQDAGVWVDESYDGFKDFFVASGPGASFTKYFRVAGQASGGDQKGDVVTAGRLRAANGSAATPAVVGADLDSGIFFATNQVSIATSGGEQYRVTSAGLLDFRNAAAQTAGLGGGAAATLGTIGGSGPATAAQGYWLKIAVGGTAGFLAVWA